MIRLAAVLAAALFALPAAAAETWRVGPAPSDVPELKAASVTNGDGHTVYLWRLEDEAGSHVFCELHLAEGMAFDGVMPVFRIDDAAAVDTAAIRAAGDAQSALWGHVGQSVAVWLISTATGRVADSDPGLRPWLAGNELSISFRSADGRERTTRFALAGSAAAIRSATGMARD